MEQVLFLVNYSCWLNKLIRMSQWHTYMHFKAYTCETWTAFTFDCLSGQVTSFNVFQTALIVVPSTREMQWMISYA